MKRLKWLPVTISFIAFMLTHPVWAEDGGGDGGDGGDDVDYDGDDHDDSDSRHHHTDHGHSHDHLMLGIGGYYNPGFWGSYYGSVLRVPDGYRSYGYGYADPFYRPYYTYPSAVAIPSQPPVYIQRQEAKPAQSRTAYWYYCQTTKGYYPYVKECPRGWLQIAPQPSAQ